MFERIEEFTSQVSGFNHQLVAKQCDWIGPIVHPYVTTLALKSRDNVAQDVSGFVASTGTSPQQMSGNAQICLGVRCGTGNVGVVLFSALALYLPGQPVYGELREHHLTQSFGTQVNIDVAGPWYNATLAATDAGADAVFVSS